MKKLLYVLALVIGLFFFGKDVNAQSTQDFSMTNNTGMTLVDVFISPNDSQEWGSDVIPTDMILDGETFNFSFSGVDPEHCTWDIMFTDETGNKWYMQDVDLCNTVNITLTSK